ncbi:MAG: hypothetical protein CMJ48_13755 [Planctomycetaceae bacterium]|nr:hypothetical protein [Planctomycetaceae bacterium]
MSLRRTFAAVALLVVPAFIVLSESPLRADAKRTIDSVERRPRSARLAAYQKALAGRRLSSSDRLALTKAFAKHAVRVSPYYQESDKPWDPQPWVAILKRGFAADSQDPLIAWAIAQLYINDQRYSDALPIVAAFKKAHPSHHHALAWNALCTSAKDRTVQRPKLLLTFPVRFCVLTRNPAAQRVATEAQCRKEIEILNANFRTHDEQQLVRFTFKGYSSYADVKDSKSELARFGDSTDLYDSNKLAKAFNNCADPRVRDRNAINFYIHDSYSARVKFADMTSHGKRNSNRPYVFIDWERLDNNVQNPEAHEMGHAFGLGHVGVPGATSKQATNIMTSAGEQVGSGGLRNLGFTEAQAALIVYHAKRTHARLGIAK